MDHPHRIARIGGGKEFFCHVLCCRKHTREIAQKLAADKENRAAADTAAAAQEISSILSGSFVYLKRSSIQVPFYFDFTAKRGGGVWNLIDITLYTTFMVIIYFHARSVLIASAVDPDTITNAPLNSTRMPRYFHSDLATLAGYENQKTWWMAFNVMLVIMKTQEHFHLSGSFAKVMFVYFGMVRSWAY